MLTGCRNKKNTIIFSGLRNKMITSLLQMIKNSTPHTLRCNSLLCRKTEIRLLDHLKKLGRCIILHVESIKLNQKIK